MNIFITALALSVCIWQNAQAEDKLTIDKAVQLAESRSTLLLASDATVQAARAMAVASNQRPDPVLRLGVNNLPIDGADRFSFTRDFMTMRSVGVMQELTREDKRQARGLRFEKEAELAQANKSLALINLQRSTATAWLDRYYQERMVELWVRQLGETKLQIEAADAAYRSGRGSQSDIFAARLAVAQIEDRQAQIERQVANARAQLARWVGDVSQQPLAEPPVIDKLSVNEATLEDLLVHHPQIALMLRQEEVAQADARIATANKKSDWTVELMASQRGSAYSNMISLNASVPLQWDQKNRQDQELAAKLAAVDALRAEREDAVRAHLAEVRAMLLEWQSNQARLKRYDDSIAPLAFERTRAALTAYRGGGAGGTLSAVLEARRAEIDLSMERIRLEMENARLWVQLNYLTAKEHKEKQ